MASAYIKSKMKNYMQEPAIRQELQAMYEDDNYRTLPGYSVDADKYANHVVPFVSSHLDYLKRHPYVDPLHYLSNLRLMLKKR